MLALAQHFAHKRSEGRRQESQASQREGSERRVRSGAERGGQVLNCDRCQQPCSKRHGARKGHHLEVTPRRTNTTWRAWRFVKLAATAGVRPESQWRQTQTLRAPVPPAVFLSADPSCTYSSPIVRRARRTSPINCTMP